MSSGRGSIRSSSAWPRRGQGLGCTALPGMAGASWQGREANDSHACRNEDAKVCGKCGVGCHALEGLLTCARASGLWFCEG